MIIFNIQINGSDAEWFCKLPKAEKIEWIKNNTNQKSDVMIEEFLQQPINNGCGCGCKGNQNESSRVSKTVESSVVGQLPRRKSKGNSSK